MAKAANATTGAATTKHAGGRPTKLTRELAEKAANYLNETKMGGLYFGDLPTVAGLSLYLDVARSTIFEWAKLDTPLGREFSDSVERLNATQEYMLVGKSVKGEYNATISKLLLSNHGYVEKQQTDLHVKEMPQPILGGASQGNDAE